MPRVEPRRHTRAEVEGFVRELNVLLSTHRLAFDLDSSPTAAVFLRLVDAWGCETDDTRVYGELTGKSRQHFRPRPGRVFHPPISICPDCDREIAHGTQAIAEAARTSGLRCPDCDARRATADHFPEKETIGDA